MTLFNSLFGMSYLILMPVFARDILLVGSRGYGFLQSVGGGGALLGAFVAAYLAYSQRRGRQVLFSSLIFGALLIGFSLSPWYVLSLVLVFIINIANQLYITLINTIVQLKLPDELRGRVMGIYGLTWDLMPLGGMIAGAIAEYHGVPVAVLIGGGMVLTMSLVLRARLLRVDR
jgi:MFS family permease